MKSHLIYAHTGQSDTMGVLHRCVDALMTVAISVVPYDVAWPVIFEKEAASISFGLGDVCMDVHHVGSTSVPGLAAKPIIDMIVVVKDLHSARDRMQAMGFEDRGEYNIPMRVFFRKQGGGAVHVHMYPQGHGEIALNLCFREYLRAHPDKRDAYARLKQVLMQDPTSAIKTASFFSNYTLRKGHFIRQILRDAGFSGLRILRCNDDTEWRAAHEFRAGLERTRGSMFETSGEMAEPTPLDTDNQAHLILYDGPEIVGYGQIRFGPNACACVQALIVDKQCTQPNALRAFTHMIHTWIMHLGLRIES